ncbi:hypothetical protein [Paractinoplanes brasiliensis]|uniref:Uncharacterized protein n=1 Tax=Paractinoplanes brasiliensis TaxID=52695 RepID=A0A4R6JZV4_9ACTN|nr:hypothetical protein [Actinoplanes brasiliensis]TDO41462.1 hypothetical protein C8E87_5195 [Actinoplanes brasiliensis]GID27252.1 hypothetical protein Abr02nite_22350 [Actinoplanes brasiliensis]
MSDVFAKGGSVIPRRRRAQLNWLLTVLPAFPLVLLVLRLWYLSRQDLPTMLLLVQYISPLGMISALFITLIWTVPAVILVLRLLGGILLVSTPDDAGRSLLAVTALRMPDWVVLLAAMLAGFTWQLRLLPTLAMLVVAILGLTAAQRFRGERWLMRWITLGVPILVGAIVLIFVWPGLTEALRGGETSTALLLGVPPLLGPLLTGPVPPWSARLVTHWPAVGAALVAPLVIGVVFLRAPVLPDSAVEFGPEEGPLDVVRGQLISVDDTSTTVLRSGGQVTFLPNDQVRSKTLCPEPVRPPESAVEVRGWPLSDSALSWIAPTRRVTEVDPRCLGRPLKPR